MSVLVDNHPAAVAQLEQLGADWHVLQTASVSGGHGIDYLVIGPAGVIMLDTNHLPGSRAWVSERCVRVNGHTTRYLGNSRHTAARVARLLTNELGRNVDVRSAVVLVDLDDFSVKQMPPDVYVTTTPRLAGWLGSLPVTTDATEIGALEAAASRLTNWRPSPSAGVLG